MFILPSAGIRAQTGVATGTHRYATTAVAKPGGLRFSAVASAADMSTGGACFDGDGTRLLVHLERVFQNLVANALKFHSDEPAHVSVSAEHHEAMWLFNVRDNGIGIPPELRD
jgi:signal transduction histidine kinase